jgi:CDP-2,3-bis-(O-geranylgeranyl)-sn-glycerol synthase
MNTVDPLMCTVFLFLAFVMAGFLQTFWLRSPWSVRFQIPIDGGRTFRGSRVFGDNKTWSGFVAMVPGVGIVFLLMRLVLALLPAEVSTGLWPLSIVEYGLLGCWVGLGFMAGELPNSFVKRRLGIPPGQAPLRPLSQSVCFLVDRVDSIAGGLLALAVVVPTPLLTWCYILLVGPAMHWAFSVLLFQLGVKARPA